MPETPSTPWFCTIHLTSQDDTPEDDLWQATCRQLYQRFATIVHDEQGDLQPLQQPATAGAKTDIVELFHQMITYGLSIEAFAGIYNLAKLWLEQRQRCEIELIFADGSKLKMRGLSWEEAEHKLRAHQDRQAQQKIVLP